MYDVIVVGARCAGSPAAMLLARRGYKVLVVDKATFPSDILSGHYVQHAGTAMLREWGLLDRVAATGCPPIRTITIDFGDFALTGSAPTADGISPGYCPRRKVIDKILVDAAAESGAEVREAFVVDDLLWRDGQVAGIRGHAKGGSQVEERARIVVGADGMNSLVARLVDAPEYDAVPTLTCGYYAYWSGLDVPVPELYQRKDLFLVAGPTNEGLTIVNALFPARRFDEVRRDVEGAFMAAVDSVPQFGERTRAARREERFVGIGVIPNYFRRPWGPGWALAGDAGYHRDPITAQGMTDSFRDAKLLADALDAGLGGLAPMAVALAEYERLRNEAVRPMYEHTTRLATLQPPPPDQQRLLRALVGNQEQTNRYFGLMAGTVRFSDFFSPENMASILAGQPAA